MGVNEIFAIAACTLAVQLPDEVGTPRSNCVAIWRQTASRHWTRDGFSLGSDADVNLSGTDCQWFAVREGAGALATTSFIGNETAPR